MTARLVYKCDGCSEETDSDTDKFDEAREHLRDEGWVARNENGRWMHYCGDCRPRGHWERD